MGEKKAQLKEIFTATNNAVLHDALDVELLKEVFKDVKMSALQIAETTKDNSEEEMISFFGNAIIEIQNSDLVGKPRTNIAPATVKIGDCRLMSEGDISAVTGAAKSRKTLFLTLLTSLLTKEENNLISSEIDNIRITYCDTEQSNYYAGLSADRISNNKNRLKYYSLREFTKEQRKVFALYHIAKHRPNLIILDGIVDLVKDFNNAEESQSILSLLMRYAKKYKTHICSVIHTNPGSNIKARGHLGTELENKGEVMVHVIKDANADLSKVNAKASRGKEFTPLIVGHTPEGVGYIQLESEVVDTEEIKIYEALKKEAGEKKEFAAGEFDQLVLVTIEKNKFNIKNTGKNALTAIRTKWQSKEWISVKCGKPKIVSLIK